MLKTLIQWIKSYFEQTRIRCIEIQPIRVLGQQVETCASGSENAYGVFHQDHRGRFLREYFPSYLLARQHAELDAAQLQVQLVDHIEQAEIHRTLSRFRLGAPENPRY